MHPDAAAFERAILADPADRTPQLIYADWLDEHDDPEFAAILRSDEFAGIPAVAASAGLSLRATWQASQGLRRLSGTVGALGVMVMALMPSVRLLGESLRSAALGFALSTSPARPPAAPANVPQIRRVS